MKLYFLLLSGIWCAPALGWYAGGSIGVSDYADFDTSDIDDGSFTNSGGGSTPRSDDTNPIGFRAFAGFDYSDMIALEAGYSYLGKAEVSGTSNGSEIWNAGRVTGETKYSGLDGSAIIRKWRGDWRFGGRLGLIAWRGEIAASDSANSINADDGGVWLLYGLVAEWNRARADLTRYDFDGDAVTHLSVGFVYR